MTPNNILVAVDTLHPALRRQWKTLSASVRQFLLMALHPNPRKRASVWDLAKLPLIRDSVPPEDFDRYQVHWPAAEPGLDGIIGSMEMGDSAHGAGFPFSLQTRSSGRSNGSQGFEMDSSVASRMVRQLQNYERAGSHARMESQFRTSTSRTCASGGEAGLGRSMPDGFMAEQAVLSDAGGPSASSVEVRVGKRAGLLRRLFCGLGPPVRRAEAGIR